MRAQLMGSHGRRWETALRISSGWMRNRDGPMIRIGWRESFGELNRKEVATKGFFIFLPYHFSALSLTARFRRIFCHLCVDLRVGWSFTTFLFWFLAGGLLPAALVPVGLRCEYLKNPAAIDERQPRLTWRVESTERGEKQTAYQIIVADQPAGLGKGQGILWDSGKVSSDQTVNVPYGGKSLAAKQGCFWKIRVWDKNGAASDWSEIGSWRMGLLEKSDWRAQYISFRDYTPVYKDPKLLFLPPARQYRKAFEVKKTVRRATVYSTALGIYELHLNGERLGEEYFAPGWSDYRQRAYYNVHDVTSLLKNGANAIGAWVADGWYAGYVGFGYLTGLGTERIGRYMYGKTPAVMIQLELEYEDGSKELIVTDKGWKVSGDGPIQYA